MTVKQWMPIFIDLINNKNKKIDYIVLNDGRKFYSQWKVKGRFRTFITSYWVGLTRDEIRMNCSSNNPEMYHKLIHEGINISEVKFVKIK